ELDSSPADRAPPPGHDAGALLRPGLRVRVHPGDAADGGRSLPRRRPAGARPARAAVVGVVLVCLARQSGPSRRGAGPTDRHPRDGRDVRRGADHPRGLRGHARRVVRPLRLRRLLRGGAARAHRLLPDRGAGGRRPPPPAPPDCHPGHGRRVSLGRRRRRRAAGTDVPVGAGVARRLRRHLGRRCLGLAAAERGPLRGAVRPDRDRRPRGVPGRHRCRGGRTTGVGRGHRGVGSRHGGGRQPVVALLRRGGPGGRAGAGVPARGGAKPAGAGLLHLPTLPHRLLDHLRRARPQEGHGVRRGRGAPRLVRSARGRAHSGSLRRSLGLPAGPRGVPTSQRGVLESAPHAHGGPAAAVHPGGRADPRPGGPRHAGRRPGCSRDLRGGAVPAPPGTGPASSLTRGPRHADDL
ncbi:MAG: possible low temperature requirement protein A, partial [uncultured Nocardioidaceae bacterium]